MTETRGLNLIELGLKAFSNEEQMQAAAMDLIKGYFPEFRDKCFHPKNEQHIPKFINESPREYEKRSMMIGNMNKRKGKLAGVPDILIRYKGIMFSIELKLKEHENKKGGGLSDDQKRIHEVWALDNTNFPVIVCYDLKQVFNTCMWVLRQV